MAILNYDRIQETSTTTGTGDFTLTGAVTGGYDRFSTVFSVNDKMHYLIIQSDGSQWETGIGTYSASNTLTRTNIKTNSSRNTSAINFSAGTKFVLCSQIAESLPWGGTTGDIWYRDSNGEMKNLGVGNEGEVLTAISGAPSYSKSYFAFTLTSNFSTTSDTATDVSGMSFPIGANETWILQIAHYSSSANTAIIRSAINGPTGCSVNGLIWRIISSATSIQQIASLTSLTSGFTVTNDIALVAANIVITNGSTSGTIQYQIASNTNGSSVTVRSGSNLIAHRIN